MDASLRIEGPNCTVYEQTMVASGHPVSPATGGAHQCNGCIPGAECQPGNTFISTLDDAVSIWDGTWSDEEQDYQITSIERISAGDQTGWRLYVNGIPMKVGGCGRKLQGGEQLLAAYGNFSGSLEDPPLLRASVDRDTISPGESVVVKVFRMAGTEPLEIPVPGAFVGGGVTGDSGLVTLTFKYPAVKRLKASKEGTIRSAAITVIVE
jgi:hypothetical protein